MTARIPLKLDSDNSLIEMTPDEIGRLQRHVKYLYGLDPSVGMTWVDSGNVDFTLTDTRLMAGAHSTSTSSTPSEGTTAEPSTQTVTYNNMFDSSASGTVATVDTNNIAFPVYQVGGNIYAMGESDFYDTLVLPAIDELTDGTDQPGTFRIATTNTLAGHTLVGGTQNRRAIPEFVTSATANTSGLITYPAGIDSDDLLVVLEASDNSSISGVVTDAVSGTYTALHIDGSTNPDYGISYKRASGLESGTTLTCTSSASAGILQVWRKCDVDSVAIFGDSDFNYTSGFSSGDKPFETITTTTDNNMLLAMVVLDDEETTITWSDSDVSNATTDTDTDVSIAMGSMFAREAGTWQVPEAYSLPNLFRTRVYALVGRDSSTSGLPVFTDTRADTKRYTAAGIGEALDQPIDIDNYYLFVKDADSDETFPLPVYIRTDLDSAAQSWVGLQEYDSASINSMLSNAVRHCATSVGGTRIMYNIDGAGNNKGTGMANTILTGGSGNYETEVRDVDDYRAQEFPDGSPSTSSTSYLRITQG